MKMKMKMKMKTYGVNHPQTLVIGDRLGPVNSLDPGRDRERPRGRLGHRDVVLECRARLGNRASFFVVVAVVVVAVNGALLGKLHFLVIVAAARRHGGLLAASGDQSDPLRGSESHPLRLLGSRRRSGDEDGGKAGDRHIPPDGGNQAFRKPGLGVSGDS